MKKAPKFEVPMYDPQTGDINPHYEELTGKKNTYAEARKNDKLSFEPKTSNKYLFKFPDEFDIKPFFVSKTVLPKLTISYDNMFGYNYCTRKEWSPIILELIDTVEVSMTRKIMKAFHDEASYKLDYGLEILNTTGVVIERWKFKGCYIEHVDFGTLSYDNDDFMKLKITIQPSDVELEF